MAKHLRVAIRRARRSVRYFADKLLNVLMHLYQVALIDDPHDTVVWAAGRGVGKTFALMIAALWKCWTTRNFRVVYVAARFGQAKLAQDVAVSLLKGTPLMDDVEVLSAERIVLSNGSSIESVPGGKRHQLAYDIG
jgi:hypothetical protein